MSQTRLYFIVRKPTSAAIFAALEIEFEDDGLPLALIEVDEEQGMDEISVYTDTGSMSETERRILRIATAEGSGIAITREEVPDIDWVAKSLEGLQPVRAGGFLVYGAHDRDKLRAGEIGIEIEAGQAFGTGHHGTTSGCLEMLQAIVHSEKPGNALDLGTGSAVLAIALAKLAQIPVLATDNDPIATAVAQQNIELNAVTAYVQTATAEGFEHPAFASAGPFALIVANILAQPLIALAPQMSAHLAADGSLVLSGILARQHDAVVSAYSDQGFRHIRTLPREDWVTLHLKR